MNTQPTNAWTEEVDKLRDQNRRMLETLRNITDAYEGRMADDENADWHECYNQSRAIIKEVEGNG